MPVHYLKLLQFLEPFAIQAGASPTHWADDLFRDLHQGNRLHILPVPPNASGPLVALVGKSFYVESGIDRERDDVLFVSRVLPLRARRSGGAPTPVDVELRLVTQRVPLPREDSVRPYFDGSYRAAHVVPDPVIQIAASARLLKLLRETPAEVRRKCRPRFVEVPGDAGTLLAQLRAPWLRHRLEQAGGGAPGRHALMLGGTLAPAHLTHEDLGALRSVINVGVLNRVAATRYDRPSELHVLFEDIAQLPVLPEVRALLWTGMLRGLTGDDLKRELHEAASALGAIPPSSTDELAFGAAILEALTAAAASPGGAQLRELVEGAKSETRPLRAIVDWASRLEIREVLEPSAEAAAVELSANEPAAPTLAAQKPVETQPAVTTTPSPAPVQIVADGLIGKLPTFDAWVLSLRAASPEDIVKLRFSLATELRLAVEALTAPPTLASIRDMSRRIAQLQDLLATRGREVPSAAALADDEREARAAIGEASAVLGEELDAVLAARPRPEHLLEIARLIRDRPALEALPNWAWESVERSETDPTPVDGRLWARLLNPTLSRRAKLVTQILSELAAHARIEDVRGLERPAPGTPIDDYVEAALRAGAERRRTLEALGEEHRTWVPAALSRGDSPEQVFRVVRALETLRQRVTETVLSAVIGDVADLADALARERRADAYVRAVDDYEARMKRSAANASLDALQLLLTDGPPPTEQPADADVTLEHNYIDKAGERARLHFVARAGAPYGAIQAPLLVSARTRIDTVVRLGWDVSSPSTEAWPSDWHRPSPTEVTIYKQDWRPHPERSDTFVYSIKLTAQARSPKAGERLRVRATSSSHTFTRLEPFEWPQLSTGPLDVNLKWPDELNPEFVRDHPIGPQKQHEQIRDRILAGSSFGVIAPRRFGKSTLLEHVRNMHGKDGIAVLHPVVCTQFVTGAGIDLEALWRRVSESMQEVTGAPLETVLENGLPRRTAFHAAKALARQKGLTTLVVLFDEAQTMFSRDTAGHQLGDRLKDLIEYHWSRVTDHEARVVLGLVGLPGLRDRAGANLMDKLRPFDGREIAEQDLNKLILKVTGGSLQTTREARLRVAQLSRNLAVAREIVERLVVRVREDGRAWVNYDDVKAVEDELTSSLREGRDIFVSSLRDVFNTAESVNDWHPSEQFPVAVALAEGRGEGLRVEGELCRRASELLGTWAAETEHDFLQRLTFTPEKVAEHVTALREAGVLKETVFTSPLVEAWLMGQCRSGAIGTPPFRMAMLAAAVPRIRRPSTLEPIGEGGQARIYRFAQDDDVFAYREALLATDEERQRFSDTMRALGELAKRFKQREAGSEFVFDLMAVGLRDDDERYAVQVYRWIDGFDLSERIAQLNARTVAHLGYCLAQAVTWLHRRNIIHRDIQPKNVVVHAENARPMLIDFGLARLASDSMKTQVATDFAAPEVRSRTPDWSRASDVWSLATTLSRLLSPTERQSEVAKLVQRACSQRPEDRPSAEALMTELEQVVSRLNVAAACKDFFEQRVWDPAKPDSPISFYTQILQKFRPRFEAAFTGLHPTAIGRAIEAADFLSQLLEAWKPTYPGGFSLGAAKHDNEVTGRTLRLKEIEFLHAMRLVRSHGTQRVSSQLARLGSPDDATIVRWTLEGARAIGGVVGIGSLATVTAAFFPA